jgi:hypothetical protein
VNNSNHIGETCNLSLPFGLSFPDLYTRDGLLKLDVAFLTDLAQSAPALHARLQSARENPALLAPKPHSELIIELAPYLEDFLGNLFGIETELRDLQRRHNELAPLFSVKRRFVQRKALTGFTVETASELDGFAIGAELEALMQEPLTDLSFATHASRWLAAETEHAEHLRLSTQYAAWATLSPQGKRKHKNGVLFKQPHKLDYFHVE